MDLDNIKLLFFRLFYADDTVVLIKIILLDTGLRNIIDKLAEFVARNGPEFESITKAKQMGNPKFGFLYGGDYYQYYQWRVSSEQTSKTAQIK